MPKMKRRVAIAHTRRKIEARDAEAMADNTAAAPAPKAKPVRSAGKKAGRK